MKHICSVIFLMTLSLLLTGCHREVTAANQTLPTETEAATVPVETTTSETETTVPFIAEQTLPSEPQDSDLVRVKDHIPDIVVELKYATEDNFTKQVIYDFEDAYLRYGTVRKLKLVQEDLAMLGWGLKIWDGFRPVSAQFRLWEVCPNPAYVSNPYTGYSSHSRGDTVDVTLVDRQGTELEMPTGFDSFSDRADRNYEDCTPIAANNAEILEILMEKHGFTGYYKEWWHFSDNQDYPVAEDFSPAA